MKKMKRLSFGLFGLSVVFFSFSCRKPEAPAPDPHKLTQPYYIQFDLIKENGDSSRVTVQWSDHGSSRVEDYFEDNSKHLSEEIGGADNVSYSTDQKAFMPMPVRFGFSKDFENSKPDTLPLDSVMSMYVGQSIPFELSGPKQGTKAFLQVNGNRGNRNGLAYLDIGNYCNASNTGNANSVARFTEVTVKKRILSEQASNGAFRYFRNYYLEVKGIFECNIKGTYADENNQYPVHKIRNGRFSTLLVCDKAIFGYQKK